MKKIMFNGRYGLTQAVIDGRKTMTRRIEFDKEFQKMIDDSDSYYYDDGYLVFATQDVDIHHVKTKYKVGEIVAVAQNYSSFYNILDNTRQIPEGAGWNNKMFVRADLMPHQIRITGIKCERLQDISDEDCLKEGINASNSHEIGYGIPWVYEFAGSKMVYYTPREAFAALIDKVSGRGTWKSNPWVVAYEFDLLK